MIVLVCIAGAVALIMAAAVVCAVIVGAQSEEGGRGF